jgi:hypothetical protein
VQPISKTPNACVVPGLFSAASLDPSACIGMTVPIMCVIPYRAAACRASYSFAGAFLENHRKHEIIPNSGNACKNMQLLSESHIAFLIGPGLATWHVHLDFQDVKKGRLILLMALDGWA